MPPHGLLSPSAELVAPSGIREIAHLVAGRPDVLHLEYGEPDFTAADHIVAAACEAAARGARYTPTAGMSDLRDALALKVQRINGLDCGPDHIVVAPGGAQGIAAAFAATVMPGDHVLIPDPGWPNFRMLATLHGAAAATYRLRAEDAYHPDVDEIRRLLGPRTRLLVLNSPSNPTGAVFPADEIQAIVEAAAENGTVVLSDEVYDQLAEGPPVPAARYAPDHVITVYSFSKTYAMTGWRVGYLVASPPTAALIARIQEPLISCVSAVSQAAALAALDGPQERVAEMRSAYRHRRQLALRRLREAGIDLPPPEGAFYLMLPLPKGTDSRAFALALVDAGVAVAPGSAFGESTAESLRVSLAASDDIIDEALVRIIDCLPG